VRAHPFRFNDAPLSITLSFGVATIQGQERGAGPTDAARFIALADAKLYEAKQAGRDRVCA
jgi:PleD family two-component response regulator